MENIEKEQGKDLKYKDKDWLYDQYINQKKSSSKIAFLYNYDKTTICRWLNKFNIPLRNIIKERLYQNKEWLYDQYIVQKKTIKNISIFCKVHRKTIREWLRKFEIERKNKLFRDFNWLYEQYITLRKSSIEIANLCNCNSTTILRWLKKHNLQIRSISEALNGKLIKERNPNWKGGKKDVLCSKCGKKIKIDLYRFKKTKDFFCSSQCKSIFLGKNMRNEKHPSWKGGRINRSGYIGIRKKSRYHMGKIGYIFEHVLVMEKELGRMLWDWEVIHHINEIKDDNKIENLYLCKNNSHHRRIHIQLSRLAIELYRSQKFGKIQFDREKGKYYIVWQNGDGKNEY